MRAAICTRYGPPDVLQVRDVDKPAPGPRDILIKVHAAAATSSDTFVRNAVADAPITTRVAMRLVVGVDKPRRAILGLAFAGEVAATGARVTRFQVGDRVCAFTGLRFGAYAQYACVPESSAVAVRPPALAHDRAAALPFGGCIALHYLKLGGVRPGQRVLIYGASGAVGTSAVQLAKHFGADVTAACGFGNYGLVTRLGASAFIDYTTWNAPPLEPSYDLVFDAVGKRKTSALKKACRLALAPGGKYISVDDGRPRFTADDLTLLTQLAASQVIEPVIDSYYPLERIADAHRHVESGHARGTVIITIAH